MIYLASRSHQKYLNKLIEISKSDKNYNLITIAGGLAFLHAIGGKCQSLTIIDSDPEVLDYVDTMLSIIKDCSTRKDFFSLLTGHLLEQQANQLYFSNKLDPDYASRLIKLSEQARICLNTYYSPTNFDATKAVLKNVDNAVNFIKSSLAVYNYNWHCNYGVFESEIAYSAMLDIIKERKIILNCQKLEDYNFSECTEETIVCASNAESPLFTKQDDILQSILKANNPNVKYLSRTRDYRSGKGNLLNRWHNQFVNLPLLAVNVPLDFSNLISTYISYQWNFLTLDQYLKEQFYDQDCILYWLADDTSIETSRLIDEIKSSYPIHQHLVLVTDDSMDLVNDLSDVLRRYEKVNSTKLSGYTFSCYELLYRIPY